MFLIFFFLLLSFSPIYADGFNGTGNTALNEFYQTTALTVSYFPKYNEYEDGITYDTEEAFGNSTDQALEEFSMNNLTSFWYARRIPNVLDRVSGPPGTVVDILYFYFNDTGHEVNISKLVFPFSRNIADMGNLNNIVKHYGNAPGYMSIDVKFDSYMLRKEGILKEYPGLGIVQPVVMGSLLLDSVQIVDPLEIVNFESIVGEEYIEISVLLKNVSKEKLDNILYEHKEFESTFSLLPSDEIHLEYSLGYEEDLGYFRITNPNTKTECSVYGSNYYNWLQPNAVTVLAFREDGGWINGAHVQPVYESFCITRLPYSITSSILRYEKNQDDDNILEESGTNDLKENKSVVQNTESFVLGIQDDFVLPKTAKTIY